MDPAMLDEIEEALIRADLGLESAARVTETISRGWYNQAITRDEVKGVIADHVEKVLGAGGAAADDRRRTSRSSSWWSASTAPARPR